MPPEQPLTACTPSPPHHVAATASLLLPHHSSDGACFRHPAGARKNSMATHPCTAHSTPGARSPLYHPTPAAAPAPGRNPVQHPHHAGSAVTAQATDGAGHRNTPWHTPSCARLAGWQQQRLLLSSRHRARHRSRHGCRRRRHGRRRHHPVHARWRAGRVSTAPCACAVESGEGEHSTLCMRGGERRG